MSLSPCPRAWAAAARLSATAECWPGAGEKVRLCCQSKRTLLRFFCIFFFVILGFAIACIVSAGEHLRLFSYCGSHLCIIPLQPASPQQEHWLFERHPGF